MKSAQLQIRLSAEQKVLLRRRAREAGQTVSAFVLSRVTPAAATEIEEAIRDLHAPGERRFALARLSDLLASLSTAEFTPALAGIRLDGLPVLDQNLVAAMVEHAAARRRMAPPSWVVDVAPLERPWFAADLPSLRAHLLRVSPTAFRRRNLFADATVGDRV